MSILKPLKEIDLNSLTFGTDPEVFVVDAITSQLVPSFHFTHGNKHVPQILGESIFLADNVMLEFNIPPCRTGEGFAATLSAHLQALKDRVIPSGTDIFNDCSITLTPEQATSPQAMEFGCEPDYNAWTRKTNKVGQADPLLRTAGGHIHLGYDKYNRATNLELIKLFDLFVGIPSLFEDKDTRRRQMYGKAGAYRHTRYGVEYRVLSNYWIFSEESILRIHSRIIEAVKAYNAGMRLDLASPDGQNIVKAIDTLDKKLAIEVYNKLLPASVTFNTLELTT